MNNKGFAVTGIIYGIMLLFVLVVTSFLTIIVGRNRRVDALVDGVYDKVNYYTEEIDLKSSNTTQAYITQRKGLYKIITDSNQCIAYLPINIILISDKIKSSTTTNTKVYYLNAAENAVNVQAYNNYNTLTCIN